MLTVTLECIVGQNMIFMMFAGAAPDWDCKGNSTVNMTADEKCLAFETCDTIVYSEPLNSLPTEFHLYCGNLWISDLISSVQMAGVLFGAFLWGQLAEMFGRKKILICIYTGLLMTGIIGSFSPNYIVFTVVIFFMGVCLGGFWCVNFVAVQETIDPTHRLLAATVNGWPFAISLFSLITWLIPHWRRVLLIVNSVGVLGLALFLWVEESPRWLLQHNRMDEFERVMHRIAKANGRELPDYTELKKLKEEQEELKVNKKKTYTYRHLFRTRLLAKHTLALAASWFTVSCVSYGLAFNVKNLPGNRYLNGFLMGFSGVFVLWLLPLLNKWVGRRPLHQINLAIAGLCCSFVLFFQIAGNPLGLDAAVQEKCITAFAILGAAFLGPVWIVVYLYSAELFPTVVRNLSNGLCSVAARVGGIVAPLLLILSAKWPPLPFVIFTAIISLNLFLAFFTLPETRNQPLPDILPAKERLLNVSISSQRLLKIRNPSGNSNNGKRDNNKGPIPLPSPV